jgi:hypothetical protein
MGCIRNIKSTSHGMIFSGYWTVWVKLSCFRTMMMMPSVGWPGHWFLSLVHSNSTVTVCIDCVDITWFEVQNWGLYTCRNTLYIISTWISVVRAKSSVSTKCLTIFFVGFGLRHISSTTTVCHRNTSPSIWYHFTCSRDINMPYSFSMSVNVEPSGNMPYDIQDTYNYINYNYTHL